MLTEMNSKSSSSDRRICEPREARSACALLAATPSPSPNIFIILTFSVADRSISGTKNRLLLVCYKKALFLQGEDLLPAIFLGDYNRHRDYLSTPVSGLFSHFGIPFQELPYGCIPRPTTYTGKISLGVKNLKIKFFKKMRKSFICTRYIATLIALFEYTIMALVERMTWSVSKSIFG